MKSIIIDSRMREIEKDYLKKLGYNLVEIPKSLDVYSEISSHPDIFCSKINDNLILEPIIYNKIYKDLKNPNIEIIKRKK